MNVYVYQASLLCDFCGEGTRKTLTEKGKAPSEPDKEITYDSDSFPKGPYMDGGGVADTPQHCDSCGIFLENPLTIDGEEYVTQAITEAHEQGRSTGCVIDDWESFYRG